MKNLVVYGLVFLISFVYTYDTIFFLTRMIGDAQVSWVDSMETTERGAESGESKEQKEKIDFPEHLTHSAHLFLASIGSNTSDTSQNISFSSSDYSQVVYSPPEATG
ncbi:MAG: hypothetical protein WKF68_03100 [Daejeonella sp.]